MTHADPLFVVLVFALVTEALACILGAAYCVVRYAQLDEGDPWLRRLVVRNVRVGMGAALIAGVIVYSFARFAFPDLGLGPIMQPLGALLIALPLAWMMWGPIADAVQWWLESRRGPANG